VNGEYRDHVSCSAKKAARMLVVVQRRHVLLRGMCCVVLNCGVGKSRSAGDIAHDVVWSTRSVTLKAVVAVGVTRAIYTYTI